MHLDPELIERYGMRRASEIDETRVEEHLLICESCRVALSRSDEYVAAIRAALISMPVDEPPFSE